MAKRPKAEEGERKQTKHVLQESEREMEEFRGKTVTAIEAALAHLPGAHNEPPPTMMEIFNAHWDAGMEEQLVANLLVGTRIRKGIAAEIDRLQGVAASAEETLALALSFLESLGPLLRGPTERESWLEAMVGECRQAAASPSERSAEQLLLFFGLGWKAQGLLRARVQLEHERDRAAKSKGGFSKSKGSAAERDEMIKTVKRMRKAHPQWSANDILDFLEDAEKKLVADGRRKKARKRDTLRRKVARHLRGARSTKSPTS
jgi:hypothetical protein